MRNNGWPSYVCLSALGLAGTAGCLLLAASWRWVRWRSPFQRLFAVWQPQPPRTQATSWLGRAVARRSRKLLLAAHVSLLVVYGATVLLAVAVSLRPAEVSWRARGS